MDIGPLIFCPVAVGVDVGSDRHDLTVGVGGVDVAEGGDGGVRVELGDVGGVVGVGVGGPSGAVGGVDDDGEVDRGVGGDGVEEGGPGAGEGLIPGGIDVEGKDD